MRKLMLICAALLAASGCSAGRDKVAAEAAVTQFHRMVDAAQYHEIYQASAGELKNVSTEQDLTRVLQQVHDQMGPVGDSQQQGWHVNYTNGVTMVNLTYNTQFANGRATETFFYRVDNGAPALAGYNINSNDSGTGSTGGK